MKFFEIEQFGKEEMSMLKGGADVTASKTIHNPDGTVTVIKTTIKDDGTVIVDKVTM